MIAYFLCNISAKYYENQIMLSRVIAKNIGDVFLRQCISRVLSAVVGLHRTRRVKKPFEHSIDLFAVLCVVSAAGHVTDRK